VIFLDLHDGQAWVSFGDVAGGVKVFDVTGAEPVLLDAVDLRDARWVSHLDEGGFVAVAGSPARLEREATSGWESAVIAGASVGAPTWALRRGDRVFLSSDEGGLQVMDLRDGTLIGELETSGNANGLDLAVDGRLAFLANGQEGLVVADVLDPTSPVALASIDVADDAGSANAVSVAGDYLALADGLGGVKLLRYDREPVVDPDDCDGDGIANVLDADDDDDGVLDGSDAAPCDPDVVCVDGTRHHRARFVADFYNLPCDHPDVEGPVTGIVRGTLPSDFDWFTDPYYVFSVERDTLLIDYGQNYFPVDTGLCQDPFHFAAHWYTTIIVDTPGTYRVEMGSDDDSWLFLDGDLQIDLGGIHAIVREGVDLELTAGAHRLDIYFAERHVRQSGLEFEMVEFPDGAFVDFQESVCLDPLGDADGDGISNADDVAPLTRD
jgi:fibro-slime domain-containing protein